MWLLLLRGASVRSDDPGPLDSLVGSLMPQRAAQRSAQAFLIHSVWTGPVAPRVTRALILRHGLERLESVEDYLLPRFIDGNPISKYVTLRFYL